MSNYRFRPKPSFQQYGTKAQQRLLLAGMVLFLAAAVAFGAMYFISSANQQKAREQLSRRVGSNLVDAIGQVSRMAAGVQSNSPIKLGQIRQHIYAMDQINGILVAVDGEKGRLLAQEDITALYDLLDRYEVAVQTATGNTLELRNLLFDKLNQLQSAFNPSL